MNRRGLKMYYLIWLIKYIINKSYVDLKKDSIERMLRHSKVHKLKVMIWTCFTKERLSSLIICDKRTFLYDLFSLVNDLLEISEADDEV